MSLEIILHDKTLKPSEKPGLLSQMLLENPLQMNELVILAAKGKDAEKGTCIEAMEHATLSIPALATAECFSLAVESLASAAPRVKWESARLIANIALLFRQRLPEAVPALLTNSEHPGTVVRWSAATALAAIVKLKTPLNSTLLPALQSLAEKEEKNSIRKIYLDGIKKANK